MPPALLTCLLTLPPTEGAGGVEAGGTGESGAPCPEFSATKLLGIFAQARRPLLADQPPSLLAGQSWKPSDHPGLSLSMRALEIPEKLTYSGACYGLCPHKMIC